MKCIVMFLEFCGRPCSVKKWWKYLKYQKHRRTYRLPVNCWILISATDRKTLICKPAFFSSKWQYIYIYIILYYYIYKVMALWNNLKALGKFSEWQIPKNSPLCLDLRTDEASCKTNERKTDSFRYVPKTTMHSCTLF